ncbi:MAG: hypothetical protein HC797_03270 [Anaerolineales bacterium]|nr:hypothetical protein [Anaerolineales bacterium]
MRKAITLSLRILLYFILVAPLLLFIAYGFSTRWFFPAPFPTELTTLTFARAMNDSRTLTGLHEGLLIAIIVSLLSLTLAFPAARVLGLRQFRGRQFAWLLLFLPTVVPPLAIGMGLNILFLQLGLAGTIFGVVLAHLVPTLPYTIFTLSSAFARYDENFEHQALALGAKPNADIFQCYFADDDSQSSSSDIICLSNFMESIFAHFADWRRKDYHSAYFVICGGFGRRSSYHWN